MPPPAPGRNPEAREARRDLWYKRSMNTFLARLSASLVTVACLAGCGPSTSTPEDIASAVVGFLADNDFEGYMAATVLTSDQFFDICPAGGSYKFDVDDFRDEFNDCREAFDFSAATITGVVSKLEPIAAHSHDCGNEEPVNYTERIEITVTNSGKAYTFRLNDVVETPDGWRQSDDMRCSSVTAGSGGSSSGGI